MSKYERIIYERKDHTVWIIFNRPEKLNARTDQLRREFIAALEEARDDEEVYVIVITGAGEKAFCAGADRQELQQRSPTSLLRKFGTRTDYELIREIPKPVIAMVNGFALGGGCEVVLACDIAIASEDAKFGQLEIKAGVIPGGGGTQILPRLVGEKRAKELIFTGRMISAHEAFQLGLVNQVVRKEELRQTVENFVKLLLSHNPDILGIAKRAINKSLETNLTAGLALEADLFSLCFVKEGK